MRAAIIPKYGGPDVVQIGELEAPEPGPGEVRIRVRASSLNHLDLWVRRGEPIQIPLPHVGGADMAGEVEWAGPGVEGVKEGTRVVVDPSLDWAWYEGVHRGADFPDPRFRILGEHTQGGFAEYAVVPAANLFQLPDDVSFETAAAAALVGVTAWRGLVTRGGVRPGDRVLVTGASGGVATMAVQIARRAGATVFALTSGPDNVARARTLGAQVVLDRLEGDLGTLLRKATGRRGVDLVLDSAGQGLWDPLLKSLAPGGRLVTYGATTGPDGRIDIRRVFWKQLSIVGSTMGSPAEFRAAMRMVFRGEVGPVIHAVLPLEELGKGHEMLERGEVFGKLAVRV